MADRTRFELREGDLPTTWFNIMPDLAKVAQPLPPLHPGTKEPLTADALAPLFPEALIEQEMSMDRLVEIPGPVLDVYRLWRPTPLFRATRLEKALGTPARIFFKYEGVSPAGSHKPNTAVAQAYYNKEAGARRVVTETGAGQWGSALAMAANFFDLECLVYMVRASYDQKPYRRIFMEAFRGTVHPSPSDTTDAGRAVLAQHPDSTGSLGIAISEAVEVAAKSADTNYALGSLLNHVLLHQSVIGQEAKKQMALAEATPDVIIGCVGGGSNFGGIAYPFLADKLRGESQTRFIAVEPAACPTLTKGRFAYDFGDTAKMTPLLPMYTLGHEFVPAPVHAGGLRYHGDSPSLSLLVKEGFVEARAYRQNPVFAAAMQFAQTQGIVSAPEPAHAIRAAIDVALEAREAGQETTILFNLCGHGHFDMSAYDDYLNGRLPEIEFDDQDLSASLADMPEVPIG